MSGNIFKLYKNKDWLKNQYIDNDLSISKIAKLLGNCDSVVQRNLKKFRIKKIKPYWGNELSTRNISKMFGCEHSVILYWLYKLGIPLRSLSESIHKYKSNHCNLINPILKFIQGEFLGDGHLHKQNKYSASYDHGSKYKKYIQYLSKQLKFFGINQGTKINKYINKNYGNIVYNYRSKLYPELLNLHKKWYIPYELGIHGNNPKRKWFKIVPSNLELTPLVCRQWYIGDGCLEHYSDGRDSINLSTCGFLVKDVLFLVEKLNNLGFKSTRIPSNNSIRISVKSTKQFLDYIGSCPIKCYKYKWNYQDNRKNKYCEYKKLLQNY